MKKQITSGPNWYQFEEGRGYMSVELGSGQDFEVHTTPMSTKSKEEHWQELKDRLGLEENDSALDKELALMSSLIDQIGKDNTAATRGAVKIRLGQMVARLMKIESPQETFQCFETHGENLINELGYELENSYPHDHYHTNRYRKGILLVEFTYEGAELITVELIIDETYTREITFEQLKAITPVLGHFAE